MFKLYHHKNSQVKSEVYPDAKTGIYQVYEHGKYSLCFELEENIDYIYYEESPIQVTKDFTGLKVEEQILFSNSFGFTELTILDKTIYFNVLLKSDKAKVLETMFVDIWQNQGNVLDLFCRCRGLIESNININRNVLHSISYLKFIEEFYLSTKLLLPKFTTSTHSVLRKKLEIIDYKEQAVTPASVEWLINNIDEVFFPKESDNSLTNNVSKAVIDKIQTEIHYDSADVYENQIILGCFSFIMKSIIRFEKEIQNNIGNIEDDDLEVVDIKFFRKIPLIQLLSKAQILKRQLQQLYLRYKQIFGNIEIRDERPKLTSAFIAKPHYLKIYKQITKVRGKFYDLSNEFLLLSIQKLSRIYELYNLNVISRVIKDTFSIDQFTEQIYIDQKGESKIKLQFAIGSTVVNLYYEPVICKENNDIDLVRIDCRKGSFYTPDFILEIIKHGEKSYHIFDTKYSDLNTIRKLSLDRLVFKYILNIGIKDRPYEKIKSLILLYPGEVDFSHINSTDFGPTIAIKSSNIRSNNSINHFIVDLIKKEIYGIDNNLADWCC